MFSPTNISGGDLGPGRLPFNYCDFYQNTYNTSGGVCWFLHTDEAEFYVKVIFVGLVVIFGILGNLLLGATVLLSSRLRCKSINIFIINLAVSNVLQLVVVAPIVTIDNLTEFFELGDIGCKSKFYLQTLFFIVPMLTISVISIDRQTCMRRLAVFGIESVCV